MEYLVHWKGWLDLDQTWEPLSHLGNTTNAVHNFYASHLAAPHHLHNISHFNFLQLFCYIGSSLSVTSLVLFDHPEVDPYEGSNVAHGAFPSFSLFAPIFFTHLHSLCAPFKPGCALSAVVTCPAGLGPYQ